MANRAADDRRRARRGAQRRPAGRRSSTTINCHHNFTQLEHHHGKDLWITRKGAIRPTSATGASSPARWAPAPTSCRGLGNAASYRSCSHGAGPRMSRSARRPQPHAESLTTAMEGKAWNADEPRPARRAPRRVQVHRQCHGRQSDLVDDRHTLRRSSTTREPDRGSGRSDDRAVVHSTLEIWPDAGAHSAMSAVLVTMN